MFRPLKGEVFMAVAEQIARLGTCDRKQVGAVVIRDGRCVAWGFNGAPPGLPHCDQNHHGWQRQIEVNGLILENDLIHYPDGSFEVMNCRNATHAEANALAFAARQGISTEGCELFVTVAPCETCARLLIAAGIAKVHYLEEYRKEDGCQLLAKAGVMALQWKPSTSTSLPRSDSPAKL